MSNILYINPIWKDIVTMVIAWSCVIHNESLIKDLSLSDSFPLFLVTTLEKYSIWEVWCISGPWAFTLLRIITLAINAAAYTKNINLKSCHFFDLIIPKYIPIIEANPREYLIFQEKKEVIYKRGELPKWIYQWFAPKIELTDSIKYREYKEDIRVINQVFLNIPHKERIAPIYIKPPHITCPKKQTPQYPYSQEKKW